MSRLEKFTFDCHACEYSITVDYDNLNEQIKNKQYIENEDLSLKNINIIVGDIFCTRCNQEGRGKVRDFRLSDANEEILFNTRIAVLCDCCNLMIPIPRTKSNPNIKTCVTCIENEEVKKEAGIIFPDLPSGVSRSCPRCDGLKKVYLNNSDKTFFVGCSNYIGPRKESCHWSSNEYFDYLNNSVNTRIENRVTAHVKTPGWILHNDQGMFKFSQKRKFNTSTVDQIPINYKGLYRIWQERSDSQSCVYVGKSETCIKRRIEEHFPDKEKNQDLKKILLSSTDLYIDLKIMNDKIDKIHDYETKVINHLKPKTNIINNK